MDKWSLLGSFLDEMGAFDEESDDYDWRDYCEDGFEYGVYPEDYETEEEYEEALEEAKEDHSSL